MKLLRITLSIMLVLSLSACRTKDAETTSSTSKKSEGKTELVMWNLYDPCDVFQGQIQEFESMHKNYTITCKKFSNLEEYQKILINELAEGEGPDIFALKNTDVLNHQKKISPVPTELMIPQQFRDTFFAVAGDDLIGTDDEGLEQIYAIPLYIDNLALYYNKQLFRDNLPSTDKPAETWEEIKEQAYALTKQDNSLERFAVVGLAAGRADNILRAIDILSLMLIQQNTKMYDEQEKNAIFAKQQGTIEGTGKPFYPARSALELYTSFGLPTYKNYSWNNLITSSTGDLKEVGVFVKGKAGMIFGYSYLYDEIDLQIKGAQKRGETHITLEDVGIAAAPQLIKPAQSGRQDALASYFPLTVSRNSENTDAAWEFINLLSSPESLQSYHEITHKPTSRKDMIDEQSVERLFGVFARQASFAKSLKTIDDESFNAIFTEGITAVIKSKQTVQEALATAQRRMDCVLKKKINPTWDEKCTEIE